jgi:Cu+-exporting ATPase
MFILAAAVEHLSEHPVAGAVTRYAAYRWPASLPPAVEDFVSVPGGGVSGVVEGERVVCGSRDMLSDCGVEVSALRAVPTSLRGQRKPRYALPAAARCWASWAWPTG